MNLCLSSPMQISKHVERQKDLTQTFLYENSVTDFYGFYYCGIFFLIYTVLQNYYNFVTEFTLTKIFNN